MRPTYYILQGHETIPIKDAMEWALSFKRDQTRQIGVDLIGDARVSTVFLGLDHAYGDEPPLLFETMIFGGDHDGWMDRYSTWDQAETGHKRVIEQLQNGTFKD